jgi:cytochrome P450
MPKETSIILAILLMQRSKEVWGKDAEEFKPERWLATDEDDQSQVSEARRRREGFVAFNAGPRTVSGMDLGDSVIDTKFCLFGVQCLGQNFALMQLSYVMAKLLRSLSDPETKSALYTVVLAPDEQPKATSPPEAWKDLLGRGKEEKVWVASNLTLYVKVSL